MTRRIVQWGTGPVGRNAIAAIVDHPDLELVATLVYSEHNDGRDAGDLAGIGPIGVTTTRDRQTVIALDADCVLYAPQGDFNPAAALDDITALLAAGKNVVSTAVTPLIYPPAMGQAVVDRLNAACLAGGTTFHGTGIEPGWAAEVLPMTLSGVVRHIDTLLVQELLDYATYDNAFVLFDVMGFGRLPDDTTVMGADPSVLGSVFRGSLMMVAEALGATIDRFEFDRDVSPAPAAFDVVAGRIEAGTVEAMRFSATAVIDGRRALTVEHVTRLRPGAAPDWPQGRGWRVEIAGLPSMVLTAQVGVHGEDENAQGLLATAMHAVHAIVPVCDAPPGIATFLDLPAIVGRHVLRAPTHVAGS